MVLVRLVKVFGDQRMGPLRGQLWLSKDQTGGVPRVCGGGKPTSAELKLATSV